MTDSEQDDSAYEIARGVDRWGDWVLRGRYGVDGFDIDLIIYHRHGVTKDVGNKPVCYGKTTISPTFTGRGPSSVDQAHFLLIGPIHARSADVQWEDGSWTRIVLIVDDRSQTTLGVLALQDKAATMIRVLDSNGENLEEIGVLDKDPRPHLIFPRLGSG